MGDDGDDGDEIGFFCRCLGYTLPPVLSDSAEVDVVTAGVSGLMVETEVELKLCVDMEVDGVEADDMVIIDGGRRMPSSMEVLSPPDFP